MPGSTIGDCKLEKLGEEEAIPLPPVTKQQLDEAAADMKTKYESCMSDTKLSDEVRDFLIHCAVCWLCAVCCTLYAVCCLCATCCCCVLSDYCLCFLQEKKGFKLEFENAKKSMAAVQEQCKDLSNGDAYIETPVLHEYTVGRLKNLPEAVTEKGEPIICNIIPGGAERQYVEVVRTKDHDKRIEELAHLIRKWVETIVKLFLESGKPPKCGRVKPLLALPMVGTGGAGGVMLSGLIADMMVDLLPQLANEFAVDILLCLTSTNDYMLVQDRRKKSIKTSWGILTEPNLTRARTLAAFAKKKQMCFFIGAGMSIPAGLPMWGALLDLINTDLDFPLSKQRDVKDIWDGIKQVKDEFVKSEKVAQQDGKYVWVETQKPWDDYLEIAEELHRSCVKARTEYHGETREQGTLFFKRVVAVHCDSPKHAVGHSMLACIPARSSITTNYDTLFEKACWGVDAFGAKPYAPEKVSVLPREPKKECNRWLLKMHGCCNHNDDIVLTAEDYAKYESSGQAALGGLVQAELMTSHMMFTGFSMTDANFKRLIDSVMDAYGDDQANREGAGTIISLGELKPEIKKQFQDYGIGTVAIGESLGWNKYDKSDPSNTNPAREMEIFMDYLLLKCTDTAYPIFSSKFESALTHSEKSLRNHLRQFLNELPHEVTKAPAWSKVKRMFKTLGSQSSRLCTDSKDLAASWYRVCKLLNRINDAQKLDDMYSQTQAVVKIQGVFRGNKGRARAKEIYSKVTNV